MNKSNADTSADFRDTVAEIVRRYLDAGQAIEIEGLGTFRAVRETPQAHPNTATQYVFTPEYAARVFVAYVAEDIGIARQLCDALRTHGCSPWLDKEQLLPGQNWPRAIEQAIDVADVFVACFSSRSIAKHGQFQCEIRYALDCARRRPLDESFIIPVRVDECRVPRRLADQVQYVDLFTDWDRGIRLIAGAAKRAAKAKPVAFLS